MKTNVVNLSRKKEIISKGVITYESEIKYWKEFLLRKYTHVLSSCYLDLFLLLSIVQCHSIHSLLNVWRNFSYLL